MKRAEVLLLEANQFSAKVNQGWKLLNQIPVFIIYIYFLFVSKLVIS